MVPTNGEVRCSCRQLLDRMGVMKRNSTVTIMFLKVLTVSVATIVAVLVGNRRRGCKKRQLSSPPIPKLILDEDRVPVSRQDVRRTSEDEWFRVAIVLLLCISALLGAVLFLDNLANNDDLLQVSVIGFLLLLTVMTILSADVITGRRSSLEAESISCGNGFVDFSGNWTKNHKESSNPEAVFDLMKIGPLLRTAVRLVQGINIQQSKGNFKLTVVSVIKFLKITEVYSLSGEVSQWNRRDLRRGRHSGFVECKPGAKSLKVHLEWNAPFAGKGTDEFIPLSEKKLLVRSTLYSDGKVASYDTVYYKNEL